MEDWATGWGWSGDREEEGEVVEKGNSVTGIFSDGKGEARPVGRGRLGDLDEDGKASGRGNVGRQEEEDEVAEWEN